jgi:hypothetical protein
MPSTETESNLADQSFAETFAARLRGDSTDSAAAPAAAPAAAAPDDPSPETESADDAADSAAAATPPDPAAPDPDADDPAEPESDEGADAAEKQDAPPSAFAAALEREGVALTLDDLPAEARPLVEKKLRDLEAGFTRARQKDTAQLVELRTEQRWQTEHAADWIVAQIRGQPEIAEQVNALLDEFDKSPTAARYHEQVTATDRATARAAVQGEADTAAAEAQAGEDVDALDRHLEQRLAAAKVTGGAALGTMLTLAADAAEARTGKRVLTRETVDTIAAQYIADVQAAAKHAVRQSQRDTRGQYVEAKLADRKTAGLKVKPTGSATPPAPAPPPKPSNDEEFSTYLAAKFAAQRRAAAS